MIDKICAYNIGKEIILNEYPGQFNIANAYGIIAAFLCEFPEMQSAKIKEQISINFFEKNFKKFVKGRNSRGPVIPETIPDDRIITRCD